MMSDVDRDFQLSVPYNGFNEQRAMAFALSEAIRVRYGVAADEFLVTAINCGLHISGMVEKADAIRPDEVVGDGISELDVPFSFGYRVKLMITPGSDGQ